MTDSVTDRWKPSVDLDRPPRVAVLWTRLSGYFNACLRALSDAGAEVLVVHQEAAADVPFDPLAVTKGFRTSEWRGSPRSGEINQLLDGFGPDAILASSWNVGAYRRVCRARRDRTLRIFGMDNQWHGTPKQWTGVATARLVLQPTYDAVYVCDERQAEFARRLGFPAERLIWGLYSGDQPLFAEVARRRASSLPPRQFLFVGRLVAEKGVDVLAGAYRRYRSMVDDPWPLAVAGTGPEEHRLIGADGVKLLGFVQPPDLPAVVSESGCLVLPSRFEPWAVVIHEATAAGLPVVCTRVCGAATRLVLDGYNGAVVSPDDEDALAHALLRIHRATREERRAMGNASESLSRQYSPDQWAGRLLRRIPELRAQVGLPAAPWTGHDAARIR